MYKSKNSIKNIIALWVAVFSTQVLSQGIAAPFDFNGIKIGDNLQGVKSRQYITCHDFNDRTSACFPTKETTDDFWFALMGTSMNPYDAELRFLDGRLISINVRPLNGRQLISEFQKKYGKPIEIRTEPSQGYAQWRSESSGTGVFVSYGYKYIDNIFNIINSEKDKEFVSVVGKEAYLAWRNKRKEERTSLANSRKFELKDLTLDSPRAQVPIQTKTGKWSCTNRGSDGVELCRLELAPRECWDEQVISPRTGQAVFNALGQPMIVQKCEKRFLPKESLGEFDRKFSAFYGFAVTDSSITFINGKLAEVELNLASSSIGLRNMFIQKYGEPSLFGPTGATWNSNEEKFILEKEKIILQKTSHK